MSKCDTCLFRSESWTGHKKPKPKDERPWCRVAGALYEIAMVPASPVPGVISSEPVKRRSAEFIPMHRVTECAFYREAVFPELVCKPWESRAEAVTAWADWQKDLALARYRAMAEGIPEDKLRALTLDDICILRAIGGSNGVVVVPPRGQLLVDAGLAEWHGNRIVPVSKKVDAIRIWWAAMPWEPWP